MKYQYVVIINGEQTPFITQNEWGNNTIRTDILEQMLCKIVKFKIKFWHGSRLVGKGTFVYGAGGNKNHNERRIMFGNKTKLPIILYM